MLRAGLVSILLAAPDAAPGDFVAEALLRGDALFARRAEGAAGGTARPTNVDAAIVEYKRALTVDPGSTPARLRLLRAYFFRGGFCGMSGLEQVKLFDEAKRLAEETVKRLQTTVKERKAAGRREVLRQEPLAAEIYLWAAISWGQWGVNHKAAAAWQGAAVQIRDLSQAVIDIEPSTLYGGGYLILGRLHSEAPKIPMLTGWISRAKGIEYLRKALETAPESTSNIYFLADTLLELDPAKRDEGRNLLQRLIATPPRPEYLVEDLHYVEQAKERLSSLR